MALSRARLAVRIMLAVAALGGLGLGGWVLVKNRPEDPNARRVGPFLATPYLQLGESPAPDALTLLWHADDFDADWSVEVRSPPTGEWRAAGRPDWRPVRLEGVERHRVYRSVLSALAAGEPFRYRVKLGGAEVFGAEARAKPAPGRPQRFVAFGDCAANTAEQRQVAYQAHRLQPDFVLITGDIVYFRGRVGEYRAKFFPVYASPTASPGSGAPLLGSTLFVAAPGNHDLLINDFDQDSDLMAYFPFWSQPLNGPIAPPGVALAPPLKGAEARRLAMLEAAGPNYPRMANFSFDLGDAHWTVLDSNPYIRWAEPALRAWVEADLASAGGKPWRFVAFHHPGFNSSVAHRDEQQMRLLCDIFERQGVAIVFSGHVHNYQRTYPLKFAVKTYPDGRSPAPASPVDGTCTLDKEYDGTARTRPSGVIYLITGAGGAKLYDSDQTARPETWKPFTHKYIADVHSFTVVDLTPGAAAVRQVDADGVTIDAFTIAR